MVVGHEEVAGIEWEGIASVALVIKEMTHLQSRQYDCRDLKRLSHVRVVSSRERLVYLHGVVHYLSSSAKWGERIQKSVTVLYLKPKWWQYSESKIKIREKLTSSLLNTKKGERKASDLEKGHLASPHNYLSILLLPNEYTCAPHLRSA